LLLEQIRTADYICSLDEVGSEDVLFVGGKAANLGLLRSAGLPVPEGFCVTIDAYDFFVENGVLPQDLVRQIEIIRELLGGKVAIRSSANCEDGDVLSMAGVFQSYYLTEQDNVEKVIEKIYLQAQSKEVRDFVRLHGISGQEIKMGLVVQRLIEPQLAGVVYTGVNKDRLLVQYVDGFGAALVDGETHGSAVLLDKKSKRVIESVNFELRPLCQEAVDQIVDYSQIIENAFDGQPQDIEFAYRNGRVFIVQARTLTTELGRVNLEETSEETLRAAKHKLKQLVDKEKRELGTETVIFSDANFSELLPRPTEMDFGVFAYIFTGSDGIPGAIQLGRIEMGYLLGSESIGFMDYIGGRPYFSIARDAATFYAGFPETKEEYFATLVNEYLMVIQKNPDRGAYPEMGLYLQDPTLEDLQERFDDKAPRYYQVYQEFLIRMGRLADEFIGQFQETESAQMEQFISGAKEIHLDGLSNAELVNYSFQILEHLRTVSCVNFVKAARLGFYYSQRLQSEIRKRLALSENEVEPLFGKLSQGLDGSAITRVNIQISEFNSRKRALNFAYEHLGHFSTGEMLEIRHPRFKDTPSALSAYVDGIRQSGYKEAFEKQKKERLEAQQRLLEKLPEEEREKMEKIIYSAQTYMALRETVKYLFIQEYSLLRNALELLENRLGLEKGDIYYLYPRELPQLVDDSYLMVHILHSRRQAFTNYEDLNLPPVIRESDLESLNLSPDLNEGFTELKGKFLAEGKAVEGVVVNLDELGELSKVETVMKQYREQNVPIILVATQMNLGHDPFIALSSALILENAAIVSHGAQRARELGKGALGGIKSKYLKTGARIYFDPTKRLIRKIEKDEED